MWHSLEGSDRVRDGRTYVCDHYTGDGTQEYGVTVHKAQETRRAEQVQSVPVTRSSEELLPSKDLPRRESPAADNRTYDLTTSNVDPARCEGRHVISSTERVCTDVRAQSGEDEGERGEERRGTVVPLIDELQTYQSKRVYVSCQSLHAQ